MKKVMMVGLIVVMLLVGIPLLWAWGTYNGLITTENAVDKSWGDVEAAYQRRLDTIPKFAKNAQFSVDFQAKLIGDYTKYREGVNQAARSGDPQALQQAANDGYNVLLIAVRQEAVPQAKLDQLTELNAQIENVERVINHERKDYNDSVQNYRNKMRKFPGNLIAGMFGFGDKPMFEAAEGAENSPDYDFNLK